MNENDTVYTTSNSIDWKAKLSSRKFWVSLIGFVTPLLIAFGLTDSQVTGICAIIMSGAQLIAYTIGEGLVDSSRVAANKTVTTTTIKQIEGEQYNI